MVVRSTVSRAVSTSVRSTLGSGGGVGTPFDPADVAGLWIRHDLNVSGDALNSISPDVQANDDQTLRRVLDRSGNAYHANQATGLNQPLFESSEYARAAARFDGSNDAMIYSGGALGLGNAASGITVATALRFRTNPTTSKIVFQCTTSNPGLANFLLGAGSVSGKYRVGGRRVSSDTYQEISSANNVITSGIQIVVGCLHFSNASALLRVNGEEEASSSSFQTAGTTSAADSATMSIGSFWNDTIYSGSADVDIAEIIVYKAAVSLSDIQKIETYLSSRHQ